MKRYYQERSTDGVSALASMVGYQVSAATVETWPADRREAFEIWAERTHLHASDNPVRVPPRPDWLPAPWQGEDDGWGPGPTNLDAGEEATA